jgi:2-polyprenyl-3-methyl-5-hydroxy-6-metoxy-1,4-benzoquinol methylase
LAIVVPRPANKQMPVDPIMRECDLQIAMGSLPRFVRRSEADFPTRRRYLVADPSLVMNWRARLQELGPGLKVGVSWRGGHKPAVRQRRSIPLDRWTPVLQIPGARFVNLQYGDCAEELAQIQAATGIPVHHWSDVNPLENLENFAAQIAALDLVVSVDNSTVHFAGALGTPVWALLHFSPNWRWMLKREDSLWYQSVRLFRQPAIGDWTSVIERVAAELTTVKPTPASIIRPLDSHVTTERPQTAISKVVATGTAAPKFDAEALHEKEKYERAWSRHEYRTHSPGLVALENLPLVEMLRKHEVRTILDAGCGSGKMMQRLMTEYSTEFSVHGFDISENCLDPFFDGMRDKVLTIGCLWNPNDFQKQYDAVLCTDVMEHIPPQHVAAVLSNLRKSARKLAYFSISVQSDLFGPRFLGEALHLTVRKPNWWFAQLTLAGFKIAAHAMANDRSGEEAQLHVFLTV